MRFIVLRESYWTTDRVIQSLIRVVSSNYWRGMFNRS